MDRVPVGAQYALPRLGDVRIKYFIILFPTKNSLLSAPRGGGEEGKKSRIV